jgi:pyrroline-5-carboxylate reductase
VRLLLIGCGKMGNALLQRAAAVTSATIVIDPARSDKQGMSNVTRVASSEAVDRAFKPDIVVIAIKPQVVATILPVYARFKKSAFLSIAAGITIDRIASLLGGGDIAIVRAMPNLAASVGESVTVAVANRFVKPRQNRMCQKLLTTIGTIAWIHDELWMDAVTALSGSGPAYVWALCEAMTKAGETLGLAPDIAEHLARQTIIGSGALLAQSNDSVETLRKSVTSPGGTTEAALRILLSPDGLPYLIQKAMQAATQRAKELSQ